MTSSSISLKAQTIVPSDKSINLLPKTPITPSHIQGLIKSINKKLEQNKQKKPSISVTPPIKKDPKPTPPPLPPYHVGMKKKNFPPLPPLPSTPGKKDPKPTLPSKTSVTKTTEKTPVFSPLKEKTHLISIISEKAKKFGVECHDTEFSPSQYGMSLTPFRTGGFKISAHSLYLLQEQDVRLFLSDNSEHQETINTFLVKKKPETLEKAASDLIKWANDNQPSHYEKAAINKVNQTQAEEILIMYATGRLSAIKRFLLTHEMGHAHDCTGIKSFGEFNTLELDFIKPHQYGEMNADLTAARDENAHEVGIAYFEWRSIVAGQPPESDCHPTDADRAKAIKMDLEKIKRGKHTP
jgi:hypothetical protein